MFSWAKQAHSAKTEIIGFLYLLATSVENYAYIHALIHIHA